MPPDKDQLKSLHTNVSRAIDSLYASRTSNAESEEVIDSSASLVTLPSNISSKISADNLKQELFGKYTKSYPLNSSLVNDLSAKSLARNKVLVSQVRQNNHKNRDTQFITQSSGKRIGIEIASSSMIINPSIALPPTPSTVPKLKPSASPLVQAVHYLLNLSSPMVPPKFKFTASSEAAAYNYSLLSSNNFDLHSLLNTPEGTSVTSYGSKFKTPRDLKRLFNHHPRWPTLQKILIHGSHWSLKTLDDAVRLKDVESAVQRGNHKSALKHKDFLSKALVKEIEKGWVLVLPIEGFADIPNLMLSPMGVADQLGISASGEFVPKLRVTHDLSFPGQTSDESVNSIVIKDTLEPCMFGHTMLRLIHRILHLRKLHPNRRIWIRKEDVKSAYRRMHMHSDTAVKTAVQIMIDNTIFLLISLRLPFGGLPCPSEFCLLSDMITDAINDLLADSSWNPFDVHSDYVKHIPPPNPLPDDIPFAAAKELSVHITEGNICKADVFVDDIITIGVDANDNLQRIVAAPCSIMHSVAHNSSTSTSIDRQHLIAEDKNEAEGAPEEKKIVLGWILNSRTLSIHLPEHKFIAWSEQVTSFISRKSSNLKDIQSLLGRLENIAIMIPMSAHFLNNLRQLEIKANISNKNQIISKRVKDDCILAKQFIKRAYDGINMNIISFRVPTKTYINDASEHGLGGFSCHGRAWAWEIPENLRGRAHINLLEFMAQLISIWVDDIEGRLAPLDCLLGMGDNTASMGWLCRSNFRENDEANVEWIVKQKVARKVAEIVLRTNTCLYRQWFKGDDNTVADSLSRDSYFMSNTTHKKFLLHTVPHQLPTDFNISLIPTEISSFISSLLLQMPVKTPRLKVQKPSDLARSNVGLLSSLASASTTSSLKISHVFNKTSSCQHSLKQCAKPPSLLQIKMNWWREQSVPPSHMWHRPSGQTIGLTPDWTSMVKCALSSKNSSGDIATEMVAEESKKLYL